LYRAFHFSIFEDAQPKPQSIRLSNYKTSPR
jgi:hypothetical protein